MKLFGYHMFEIVKNRCKEKLEDKKVSYLNKTPMYYNIIHTTKTLSGLWSGLEFPLNNNSHFISVFGFGKVELTDPNPSVSGLFLILRILEIVPFALNIRFLCTNVLCGLFLSKP